jgi:multiple sugar transport system permease protein
MALESVSKATEIRRFWTGMAFISPWLIGFSLFMLLPIAMLFYYSFCDFPLVQPPVFAGLENYKKLLTDPVFLEVTKNSLIYMAMALPMGLFFSLTAALMLNNKVPGQSIFRTIVFIPSLIPSAAMAMLWLWLLNAKQGLINMYLNLTVGRLFHIQPPGWLAESQWVIPALVLISLWSMGNTIVIYMAGLQDVPRELYEAADLDGAGPLQRMWHVTLPIISPVIFFNLVTAIIGVFNIVDLPYIMTQGGPGHSSDFLSYYIYRNTFKYEKMGYACAMSWIQLLIILALTAIAFGTSRKWVYYQGGK